MNNQSVKKGQTSIVFTVGIAIGIIFGFALSFICDPMIKKEGYKQGQIDAFNNKIKYELKEQSDGSKTWEEINAN